MSDLIGRTLGKYQMVALLGKGGMAEVYQAYQPALERYVAIKILHSHLAGEADVFRRFKHEAAAIARLNHPNIVQVYDFDVQDDQYYMVMELIAGATLKTGLDERHAQGSLLTLNETADIVDELAGAIDYAHAQGMVHRDLKPANIMFSDEGRVMLTDFGLAFLLGASLHTAAGSVTGTPAYMSPEQGRGERGDTRSDLYSLGVILFEMVTGRIPFEADTPWSVIVKHVNDPLPPPRAINPDLPRAIENVLYKAMSKAPEARYQTAGEMARALRIAIGSPQAPSVVPVAEATDMATLVSEEPDPSVPVQDWERLQKYLTAEMYQESQSASPVERAEICLAHLNQLLRAVVTYLPRHVALALFENPAVAHNTGKLLEGTLLFADISGFTTLSEKLEQMGGKEGAEEIVRVINAYLDVMLCILFKHDGILIKFGGDAMLGLFTGGGQEAVHALRAAWEMKQTMARQFGQVEVFQQVFPLSMKVGGNSGFLFAASVGTADHMEYVLTGNAVEQTARAESAAHKGDIFVSQETYELVKDSVEVKEVEGQPGFYRLVGIRPSALPLPSVDRWAEIERRLAGFGLPALVDRLDALTPYLPAGVLPQLVYDPRQGQIEGQHRRVTILFANFGRMSDIIKARGSSDPKGITADLSEYFKAVQEEVQYYGGVIDKVDLYDYGDKILIVFGAPVAFERDVHRAALTALAMQTVISRLPSPIASALLSQRIGIHSGYVFAGNVGASGCNRREYTVMGDTVNLAARLMSAAPQGKIWVSQHVWSQIEESFEAQQLPSIRAKGIREPVSVYELQAAHSVQVDSVGPSIFYSDIVGREPELAILQTCLDDLISGLGKQIVAVAGEGGVGKSRLVAEWQQRAAGMQSVTWSSGRGYSYGQRTHGVFIEVLERLLALDDDDSQDARWHKLSAAIRDMFTDAKPGWFETFSNKMAYIGQFLAFDLSKRQGLSQRIAQLDAETLQIQTRLAICELVEHAAREKPLVLILEDLHWADDASLDLIEFVLERTDDNLPLLFCLVYRSQKERAVWQTWRNIERAHPDCRLISLQELEKADGRLLLSNLMQSGQLDEDFLGLILTETDGNPLYVEQVLYMLVKDGVLVQSGKEWRVTRRIEHIRVPDTLYQIIQSRIDELDFVSPGARRLLWMAAIAGESFAEAFLLHLFTHTGRDKGEFSRHLRALRNAAMIERTSIQSAERPQRGYQFRHGLVWQVAYENMLVEKRCEYHGEAGRWLESRHEQDLPRYYHTLAFHYDNGRQWAKAFHYHRLAGERDARAYANDDAVRHLARALKIAPDAAPDANILALVHFELGKALVVGGGFDRALEHLTRADALLVDYARTAAGRPNTGEINRTRARVCYEIGRIYERRGGHDNLETALTWRDKGLSLLPETPTSEAALLHVLGGIVSLRQGNLEQVDSESGRALLHAQAAGAARELGTAHRMLSVSLRAQGQRDLAMEHCRHSIAICEKLGDLIGLAKDYSNRGVIALEMDNWPLAQDAYLRTIDVLERAGDRFQIARVCCNLGDLYFYMGHIKSGLAYTRRGLDIYAALKSYQGIVFARTVLAMLLWRQGDLTSARGQLEQARVLIQAHDVKMFEPSVGRWLAQVHVSAGDIEQAEAELHPLLALDQDALDEEAEPVYWLWGQVLAAQGSLAEAARVLQESLARLEQRGARFQLGHTLLALADVHVQVAGTMAKAMSCARRAREIFDGLGAEIDLQKTDAWLIEKGASGS